MMTLSMSHQNQRFGKLPFNSPLTLLSVFLHHGSNVAQPHGIMNNPTIKVEPAGYNIDKLTLSNVKKETRDDFSNVFFDFDTKTLVRYFSLIFTRLHYF